MEIRLSPRRAQGPWTRKLILNGREPRIVLDRLSLGNMQFRSCTGTCRRERNSLEDNSSSTTEMVQRRQGRRSGDKTSSLRRENADAIKFVRIIPRRIRNDRIAIGDRKERFISP